MPDMLLAKFIICPTADAIGEIWPAMTVSHCLKYWQPASRRPMTWATRADRCPHVLAPSGIA